MVYFFKKKTRINDMTKTDIPISNCSLLIPTIKLLLSLSKWLLLLSLLSQSLLMFFFASAGCEPCTQGISHSSQSFCSYISTSLRICADPSMQIFWISVTVAASDTSLCFPLTSSLLYTLYRTLLHYTWYHDLYRCSNGDVLQYYCTWRFTLF